MEEHAPHLILGTAGHIDHGKSSLIKVLTGTDPDRLLEEKQRGITIELGFAQLMLSDGSSLGVVDVPGHERFIRQMIAGSTGIDVALLCIAADDGIMPQTIEHLAVLELLAVPNCVIALTKTDLVDADWIEFVTDEIRDFLSSTPYGQSAIIPTSSKSDQGLDELKDAILAATKTIRQTQQSDIFRLPIDRVFTIKGSGTVITGTQWSGTVRPDDEVELLPQKTKARVRFVQVHGEQTAQATAGNRVALNLNLKKSEVHPGDFLATPQKITPTERMDVYFTFLGTTQGEASLKSGTRVHVAHGTREVNGRILFMDKKEALNPQESDFAQLRLEKPLPVSWGDRFIIRSYSPVQVIGGGMILLSHPRHRTNLTDDERSLLESLRKGDEASACRIFVNMRGGAVTVQEVSEGTGLNAASVKKHIIPLCEAQEVIALGDPSKPVHYITPTDLKSNLSALDNLLVTFHAQNPNQTGIAKPALLQAFSKNSNRARSAISEEYFDALLFQAAQESRIIVSDGEISHPKAGVGAKKLEEQAVKSILEILKKSGNTPPLINDLIAQSGFETTVAHRALNILEKQGEVQNINTELCLLQSTLDSFIKAIKAYLTEKDKANVAELKDAMQTSRKFAVPVLEYFDKQGLTKREGDGRSLR